MILICLLVLLSIILFVLHQRQQRIFKKVEHIPGPPTIPFLGNALEVGTNAVDILQNLKRLSKKYGPIVRLCVGFRVFILLSEPKYVAQVFKHNNEGSVPDMIDYALPLTGKGLIALTGKTWNRHRRILNRFFNAKHLEKYATIINRNCNKLVSRLSAIAGCNSVDITHETLSCSLNIICNAVMQIDAAENVTYLKAAEGLLNLCIKRVFSIVKKIDFFYRLTNDFKLVQTHTKTLNDFYDAVLAKHKLSIFSEDEAANKGAIIDELLSLQGENAFTYDEIQAEMRTLIATGSETIGTSLAFMLYELSRHPDVQEKILEETLDVLGPDKNVDVTLQNAEQLKYTECVVKETLRLYTPAYIFPALLDRDLKYGDLKIPAGTNVFLDLGAMHVSPIYHLNPENFLPERFLVGNSKDNPAFMPFGIGPKMCLGHKFAALEVKIALAKLVRNFKFSLAQPEHRMVLKLESFLKSANGVPISLKLRE